MQKESTITRNLILAVVSSGTYAVTQIGTQNSNIARDSFTFGATNAIMQEFVPKIVGNDNLQSLFIDPLIASIVQGLIKIVIYGDTVKTEHVLLKSIIAGVSGSALTLHIHDGIKKY